MPGEVFECWVIVVGWMVVEVGRGFVCVLGWYNGGRKYVVWASIVVVKKMWAVDVRAFLPHSVAEMYLVWRERT